MYTTKAYGMGPLPAFVLERSGGRALQWLFDHVDLPRDLPARRSTRIHLESLHQLFDAAAKKVGDPTLGFAIGEHMDPVSYGNWGRYVASGRTLGEALRRAQRTLWIHQGGAAMELTIAGDYVVWRYRTLPSTCPKVRCQHTLHLIPIFVTLVRSYLGPTWLPAWIEVDCPRSATSYEAMMPVPWRFDAPSAGIAIERGQLATVAPLAHTTLPTLTYADVVADELLAQRQFVQSLLGLISARLLSGEVDFDGLASRVGMGPRTLRRRLAEDGATYRHLLDHARLVRAKCLLAETQYTVSDIAQLLVYEEQGNFTRSFKKLTGRTPSQFRSEALTAGAFAPPIALRLTAMRLARPQRRECVRPSASMPMSARPPQMGRG